VLLGVALGIGFRIGFRVGLRRALRHDGGGSRLARGGAGDDLVYRLGTLRILGVLRGLRTAVVLDREVMLQVGLAQDHARLGGVLDDDVGRDALGLDGAAA